jgi:hypothetical protein
VRISQLQNRFYHTRRFSAMIDGLEKVVLEAMWLKHDGDLRRRVTLR